MIIVLCFLLSSLKSWLVYFIQFPSCLSQESKSHPDHSTMDDCRTLTNFMASCFMLIFESFSFISLNTTSIALLQLITDCSNFSGLCWLWFSYCCITNYYKFSHLNPQPITSPQFCLSEIQAEFFAWDFTKLKSRIWAGCILSCSWESSSNLTLLQQNYISCRCIGLSWLFKCFLSAGGTLVPQYCAFLAMWLSSPSKPATEIFPVPNPAHACFKSLQQKESNKLSSVGLIKSGPQSIISLS